MRREYNIIQIAISFFRRERSGDTLRKNKTTILIKKIEHRHEIYRGEEKKIVEGGGGGGYLKLGHFTLAQAYRQTNERKTSKNRQTHIG